MSASSPGRARPRALILALHVRQTGGIEHYILGLARALRRAGFDCDLVACLEPNGEPVGGFPAIGLAPADAAAYPEHERRWPEALAAWLDAQPRRADLLISAHPFTAPQAGPWARRHRVPWWTIYHGVEAWELYDSLREQMQIDGTVIAVSRDTADAIERQVEPASGPVRVLHPLVDTDVFRPAPRREGGVPTLLTVSRIWTTDGYKGHDVVLEALPWLMDRIGRSVDYVVVGDGRGRPRLEHRVRELGLESRVRFTGRLSLVDLVDAYQCADIFAMPSRKGCRQEDGSATGEGFGIVYIEAAACGCPSVALAQGGVVEAVRHGVSGLLAETEHEFREALLGLLASPDRALDLGRSARDWVVETYSTDAFDRRLRELLSGSGVRVRADASGG